MGFPRADESKYLGTAHTWMAVSVFNQHLTRSQEKKYRNIGLNRD